MANWYWHSADGIVVNLQSPPFLLERGMTGHLMPVFKRTEKWIGEAGMLTGIRAEARDVFLPLLVRADDLTAALRLCARYWFPRAGDGLLRMVDENGNARVLKCRYAGGLEGNDKNNGSGWQRIGLRLRALSPYWQAETARDYVFEIQPPVTFFQTPFFPLRISRGSIDGLVTVQNDGDVETYPIITAIGPLTSLEVQNLTSGKTMNFPALSMTANDVLVVDARPDALRVTLNGANAWGLLTATSSLWAVGVGANQLKIITTGTDDNSSVTVSFSEQYLTV